MALHPHLRFDLVTRLSSQLAGMVEQGKLQLGFINGSVDFSGEKKLVLREQAYLASSQSVSLDRLPSLPYLTYFKDPCTQQLLESWWQEHYRSPFPRGLTVKDGSPFTRDTWLIWQKGQRPGGAAGEFIDLIPEAESR